MKKQFLRLIVAAIVCTISFTLSGCSNKKTESKGRTDIKGEVVLESEMDKYDYDQFSKASGWTNGGMFNCLWDGENVNFEDGVMTLSLTENKISTFDEYNGGELRSSEKFHYGMYEVRMKPAKNSGVVSSFFTYTGPTDGTQWDEIDIEFLGKDTTKVQFNYWTNGHGENEYLYDLGFDASEEFHTYGFEWLEGSITWYVDGQPVYQALDNIPKTPSKLMMNLWPGKGVDEWLGSYDGKTPLKASYDWVKYTKYDSVK